MFAYFGTRFWWVYSVVHVPDHGSDAVTQPPLVEGFRDRVLRESRDETDQIMSGLAALRERANQLSEVLRALGLPVAPEISGFLSTDDVERRAEMLRRAEDAAARVEEAAARVTQTPKTEPAPESPREPQTSKPEPDAGATQTPATQPQPTLKASPRDVVRNWVLEHPGKDFNAPDVAADTGLPPATAKRELEVLTASKFVTRKGFGVDAVYRRLPESKTTVPSPAKPSKAEPPSSDQGFLEAASGWMSEADVERDLRAIGSGITESVLVERWGVNAFSANRALRHFFGKGMLVVESFAGEFTIYGVRGVAEDALEKLPKPRHFTWEEMPTWKQAKIPTISVRVAAHLQAVVVAVLEDRPMVRAEVDRAVDQYGIGSKRTENYIRDLRKAGIIQPTGTRRRASFQDKGRFSEEYTVVNRSGTEPVIHDQPKPESIGTVPTTPPKPARVQSGGGYGLARTPTPRNELMALQVQREEKMDDLVSWLMEHPGRVNASDLEADWTKDERPMSWFAAALKTLTERGVLRETGTMLSKKTAAIRAANAGTKGAQAGRESIAYELASAPVTAPPPKETVRPPTLPSPAQAEGTGGEVVAADAPGPAASTEAATNQDLLNRLRRACVARAGEQFAAPDIAKDLGVGLATTTRMLEMLVSSGVLYGANAGVARRYRYERPTDPGAAAEADRKRRGSGNGGAGTMPVAGTGRGPRAAHKEVQAILNQCVRLVGQENISQTGGHWSIRCPNGERVHIASTPSSARTLMADKARLRRVGGLAIT